MDAAQEAQHLTQSTEQHLTKSKAQPHGQEEDLKSQMARLVITISKEICRLLNILQQYDLTFRTYIAMCQNRNYSHFLFLSEQGENTCNRCHRLHGQLLNSQQLITERGAPPLHPNCKCHLIAVDAQAVFWYHIAGSDFLAAVERALDNKEVRGGIFFLDHQFERLGINAQTLLPVQLWGEPAVTETGREGSDWISNLGQWAVQFGKDAVNFVDTFFLRGQYLFDNAAETMDESPLLGLALFADALSFSIASGVWEGIEARAQRWEEEPSLYNSLNFFTLGAIEMLDGAIFPEETMSFEHVMNLLGTVGLIYSVYQVGNHLSARGDTLPPQSPGGYAEDLLDDIVDDATQAIDNLAGTGIQTIDDLLDDIARQSGEIVKITPADEVNRGFISNRLYPPHKLETNVYQVKLTEGGKYVRVYDGTTSSMMGSWIMRADDLLGLTAEQIRDKFALPEIPKYVCDVDIPIGTTVQVSIANEVPGWGRGNGIQFDLMGQRIGHFYNERLLP